MNRLQRIGELFDESQRLRKAGKSPFKVLQKVSICHLDAHIELPYKVSVRVSPPKDCPEGLELSKRELTLEEAYNSLIVPYPNCTRYSGCVCRFLLIPMRDNKGNLILKGKD